jgi:hypothetical protein
LHNEETMQITLSTPAAAGLIAGHADDTGASAAANALADYQIIRRNGSVVPFEPSKISVAMMKAFLAVHGTQAATSTSVRESVDALTQAVIRALVRSRPAGGTFHIEDVQDQVELGLMRGGHHEIARAYVLYRERRAQERARQSAQQAPKPPVLHVLDGGQRVALDLDKLKALIAGKTDVARAAKFLEPLNDGKLKVVFGIITHKDKAKQSLNLPLFSRISLMRCMKELKVMGIEAEFGFIKDQSPKSAGKAKKRPKI